MSKTDKVPTRLDVVKEQMLIAQKSIQNGLKKIDSYQSKIQQVSEFVKAEYSEFTRLSKELDQIQNEIFIEKSKRFSK